MVLMPTMVNNSTNTSDVYNISKLVVIIIFLLLPSCNARSSHDFTKEDVPYLIKALNSRDSQRRSWAAARIGYIGPDAYEAIPDLITALDDEAWYVRNQAALALGRIGPRAIEALPAIIELLNDRNDWVRENAAEAIGFFGKEANEAIPGLSKAMNDDDIEVRRAASFALGSIGPEEGVTSALVKGLKDPNSDIQAMVKGFLKKFIQAKGVTLIIADALKTDDYHIRRCVVEFIGEIKPPPIDVVPILYKLIDEDPDTVTRNLAKLVIEKIESNKTDD